MNKLASRLTPWLLVAILAPSLAGCFGAIAVGAGAGTLMLADRRISETYLADEGIEIRAANRIREQYGDKVHVNVTSYNRTVLLTGEVPDAPTKEAVEKLVSSVNEIRRMTNELSISGNSSFSARSNDTYLTSKVKARFLDAARFPINVIKVVTENGGVYLMGLVTQAEADAAVEIARTTGGVLRVIRVFEVISDEQARQLDKQQPPRQENRPAK